MPRCSILTDSAAALDQETIERLSIKVLPLSVNLGSETYREGVDITPEQFLSRMAGAGRFPTMIAPTIAEFHSAYEELSQTSGEILSLHASAPLCPALETARQAAGSFVGRCKIEVMDTETISRGEGILVRSAAVAALQGQSLEDIVRLLRGLIPHVYSIFFVESLDYLEHNGRIGVAQAILGTMLGVKPLLTIEDGDIIPMEKVRSREKAVEKLAEFIAEFSHMEELALLEDRFTQDTAALLERLDLLFPGKPVPIYSYGPSLAVHLGPVAMGAVIYEGA
jgi:DegV family protein with EDD domain